MDIKNSWLIESCQQKQWIMKAKGSKVELWNWDRERISELGTLQKRGFLTLYMGVSKNSGTLKSSILIGFPLFSPSILGVFPYCWKHPSSRVLFGSPVPTQRLEIPRCWKLFFLAAEGPSATSCGKASGHWYPTACPDFTRPTSKPLGVN